MTFDEAYEIALGEIADGLPVAWAELARRADTPDRRTLVKQLQILGGVGATVGVAVESPPADPNAETVPEVNPRPFDPSRRWGRFGLLRPLGKGSYGTVYLGSDGELQRDVAIKLFHGRVNERVKLEGRLLARIKHDHVVKVYDAGEHDGRFGLCMEFIDGRTLADIVRSDGPLSAEQAAIDGQAICKALGALHANNVLHRDVTARNVMRERGGRIVLMDLGAGIMSEQGRRDLPPNVGTPLFMAPELFDDGAGATPQTDVYSLGVLLYYLVTSRYPVEGRSVDDIARNHRAGERHAIDQRRPALPLPFIRLVDRATAPRPADRYESIVGLLRDLNDFVSPPPLARVETPSWRSRLRTASLVALGAVALAGLSGLLTSFAFNYVVGRPAAFDSDTPWDKLVIGARAMVQPLVVMGGALGIGAVITLIARILGGPVRLWRRFRERLLPADLEEEDRATRAAQVAVLVGFAAIIVGYVASGPMLFAFTRSIATDPLESFDVLRPGPETLLQRVTYRSTVALLLLIAILAWKNVRTVRLLHGGVVPGWMYAAGTALVALLFIAGQAPYKLMQYSALPVVTVGGDRCSLVGERADQALVFCAAFDVPRVRSIPLPDPSLTRCNFDESIFIRSTLRGCTEPSPK